MVTVPDPSLTMALVRAVTSTVKVSSFSSSVSPRTGTATFWVPAPLKTSTPEASV